MKSFNRVLEDVPTLLASKVSIVIYLALFFYLVIFALLCEVIPALSPFSPSNATQLIMGNYTNVLSALGASIAAGAGVSAHKNAQAIRKSHETLLARVEALHEKLDRLEGKQSA